MNHSVPSHTNTNTTNNTIMQSSIPSSSAIYHSLSRDTVAASESLSAMLSKEQSCYAVSDYLHPSMPAHNRPEDPADVNVNANNANNDNVTITESDRLKIVDWCYSVIDQCQFSRDTVTMTMKTVDRFLSFRPSSPTCPIAHRALRDRKDFQLVAMAALYSSTKTNERVALGSAFFAATSRGTYSVREIEDMEMALLKGLEWRIHCPSPVQMAHRVLSLVLPFVGLAEETWARILDDVRFRTEHAVRDYYFALQRPSTVAMAAIFDTLEDVLDKRERRAVLHALLLVMDEEEFDSPQALFDAKARMQALVGRNNDGGDNAVADQQPEADIEDDVDDDVTVVSEASIEVEDCSTPTKRGIIDDDNHVESPRKRARAYSPDAVASSPQGPAP